MDEALVLPLESLGRDDVATAGGKAANLGELLRAGLPVPCGFCVTTASYALAAAGIVVEPAATARGAAGRRRAGRGRGGGHRRLPGTRAAGGPARAPRAAARRDLAGLREVPKASVATLLARVRSELLVPVGEDLTRRGHLERPEDLFFLDLREARDLLAGAVDLRPVIRERRATYEAELRRRHVPRILLSDGTEPAGEDAAETPAGDVAWDPPIPGSTWVRRQVLEHMPDPLSPLFEELYLRTGLEQSMDVLLELFVSDRSFRLEDVADRPFFATVNGFAYQRADYRLRLAVVPDMLRMTVLETRVLFGEATQHWRDQALPAYLTTVSRWRDTDAAVLSDDDLVRGIRELAWADAAYWWTCTLLVGAAKLTDGLLNGFLAIAARGRDHLDPARAAQASAAVGAVDAVPIHFGTLWPIGLEQVRPDEVRSPGREFARHAVGLAPRATIHELRPGQTVRLQPVP
ncbi:MAG: hypothetical protein ACR2GH_16785 [Pseudonocardia sp.]